MKKRGFTLVELLVVMSVISLLMAILMPVLANARQQCRGVVCLSNLRQMVIAADLYTQTYDDYYPIAQYHCETNNESISYTWDFSTFKNKETGEENVEPGLLWHGETIEKIQQCPSFKGSANASNTPFSGYNYNTSYIGHGEGENVSGYYSGEIKNVSTEILPGIFIDITVVMPAKVGMVRKPNSCALFGDGGCEDDTNKFMRAPLWWDGDTLNSLKAAGTQSYRHMDKTNVGWADGHASSQKQLYVESASSVKNKLENYNKNAENKVGFLSPDNSAYDLK